MVIFWETKDGSEGVIAMLTANVEVVYVVDHAVDQIRTDAWKERFGPNIYRFNARLPKPDRRYKVWLRCTRCYAQWVFAHGAGGAGPSQAAPEPPPQEEEDVFGFGRADVGSGQIGPASGSEPRPPLQRVRRCRMIEVSLLSADHFSPTLLPRPEGFGGGLEASEDVAMGEPIEVLTPGQIDTIARRRAEALERQAAAKALHTPAGTGGAPGGATAQPTQAALHSPRQTCTRDWDSAEPRTRSPRGSRARGSSADVGQESALPAVPLLPIVCGSAEPVRDLNLFLQRHRMDPARFDLCLEAATDGLWTCEASAGGVSARGTGRGKAAARREAAKELLRALQEFAGSARV